MIQGFSNLLIFGFIDLIEADIRLFISASIKSINPKINKFENL